LTGYAAKTVERRSTPTRLQTSLLRYRPRPQIPRAAEKERKDAKMSMREELAAPWRVGRLRRRRRRQWCRQQARLHPRHAPSLPPARRSSMLRRVTCRTCRRLQETQKNTASIQEKYFPTRYAQPGVDIFDRRRHRLVREHAPFLTSGALPPKDAVAHRRARQLLPYEYSTPTGPDPFSITTEISIAPWNMAHRLVLIGLQGKKSRHPTCAANLVFLIDSSGR